MKNAKKIVISAAFLLVAVGGLMTAAAAVRGDFDMENRKGLSYEMKTFEVKEGFSDIHVEDAECNVRILRAADGNCKVVCPDKQDGSIYHTVTVSDGVLSVRCHDERKWYQYIGISFGTPDVEIYLPEKEYGQLTARSNSGSIRVDDGFTFENAGLESTSGSARMYSEVKKELKTESASGDITIENASPETLAVKTSSGRIVLSHIRSAETIARSTAGERELTDVMKELKVESTSGDITIENASPENLAVKTSSGRIVLSHIRSGEITARSTAGKIELTDVIAEKNLYAKSSSGGVALDGCDGGTIKIETTSGSVKGTLLSDKIFITDSTSGSVKIPRSSMGGECEITTTSGSIAIEIKQ